MIAALARSTAGKVLLGAYAATAVVCAFLPLADHIGFELAAILTIVAGLFAPAIGFAAMRLESQRDPREQRPARAAASAGFFAVGALLLPTLLILLNGVRRPICDPVAGSVWLILLSAPTAWLAATLGALARGLFRSTAAAAAAVIAVIAGSAVASFVYIYTGPAAFVLDHFGGYIFGIARASIPITPAVVSFRAATVAWGAAMVTIAGMAWTMDPAIRRMHRSWAIGLVITLVTISVGWGDDLGWRTTDASLRRALAGEQRIDGLVIHYPSNAGDAFIDALVRDAVYTGAQVRQALGITPATPVHIWAYANSAQKARLVGLGGTPFAKPWRHEVHLSGGWPNPSMRHELIHAFAAEFASGPWKTPGGLIPNAALIEGVADAFDLEDGSLTLFQDAKAMKDLGIAPRLERLMSVTGFEGQSVSRAYAYSAAFVRYLDHRFGTAAVRQLYLSEDFTPFGDVRALIDDFEKMLDTVQSSPTSRSTSARRHSVLAATKRTCAREIYRIVDSAETLAANRRWDEALRMYDRACALQPENADLLGQKLAVAIRMRPPTIAPILEVAESLLAHPRIDPTLEAMTQARIGDMYLRYNDIPAARRHFQAAAAIPSSPDTRRSIAIKLISLDDSVRLAAIRRYFTIDAFSRQNLFRSIDAAQRHPNEPVVQYLLAREYFLADLHESAAPVLARVSRIGFPDADIAREVERMLTISYSRQNQCDEAARTLERFTALGGARAEVAMAGDWVNRCRFAVAKGWRPL